MRADEILPEAWPLLLELVVAEFAEPAPVTYLNTQQSPGMVDRALQFGRGGRLSAPLPGLEPTREGGPRALALPSGPGIGTSATVSQDHGRIGLRAVRGDLPPPATTAGRTQVSEPWGRWSG